MGRDQRPTDATETSRSPRRPGLVRPPPRWRRGASLCPRAWERGSEPQGGLARGRPPPAPWCPSPPLPRGDAAPYRVPRQAPRLAVMSARYGAWWRSWRGVPPPRLAKARGAGASTYKRESSRPHGEAQCWCSLTETRLAIGWPRSMQRAEEPGSSGHGHPRESTIYGGRRRRCSWRRRNTDTPAEALKRGGR